MSNVKNQTSDTAQIPDNTCTEQVNAKYAKRCICVFLGIIIFGTAYVMLSTSISTPGLAFLLSIGIVIIFGMAMSKVPAESFINNNPAPAVESWNNAEPEEYYEDPATDSSHPLHPVFSGHFFD